MARIAAMSQSRESAVESESGSESRPLADEELVQTSLLPKLVKAGVNESTAEKLIEQLHACGVNSMGALRLFSAEPGTLEEVVSLLFDVEAGTIERLKAKGLVATLRVRSVFFTRLHV